MATSRRLHYVDWLRVLAVLLLFPFHVSRVFNAGEAFYVKAPVLSSAINWPIAFVDTWHMPLLFFLAGASTCLSLGKRTGRTYVLERVTRLFVPLVFGILVVIPPQTWYGARFNSGYTASFWSYIVSGDFLVWNIRDGGDYFGGFGIGHLWFILFLFLISLIVLPLALWGRGPRGSAAMRRFAQRLARPPWWLLAAALILLGEAMPDIAGKNLLYYLVFFVLGYVAMNDERFMESAEKYRWPVVVIGAALTVGWILTGALRDSLPDPSLPLAVIVLAGMLARWLMIVGFLGMGRRYLDRPSRSLSYLAGGSYQLYILHQTVIVVLAFYIVRLAVGWPVQWLVLLIASVLLTFALYEVVRRLGPLRIAFGMRTTRDSASREPAAQVSG